MQSIWNNKVIWLVNLSILISFIKVFEIPPVIPTLVSDLNISYAQAGLFMSVYAVMKCLASSPAGVISDNWGAVPIMSVSLLGICIFGVLGTIGGNFELLLLSNPLLMLIAISMGSLFIEVYGVTTWIPPYLTDVYQFSPAEVGLSSMMLGIVMIPAAIVTGYFATNRVRILWLTLSGGVVASSGIMVLIMVQLSPWETALVISALTWGQTQAIVTIMSMASIIVPKHSAGKAIGIVFTLGYGGAILATYLGGYLVTSTGNYDVSLIMFAIASTLAGAIIFTVCQMISRKPPEHFALIK